MLFRSMSEEEFDKVIEVNLKGAFNCMKHVSRIMLKQRSGHIINIDVYKRQITTGASQDIKQVTQYARAMVTKFGMSDELGLINYDSGEGDEVFIGKEIGQ